MEATHIHLLLNHIPILGSVFGVILLIIGMFLKNRTLEITGVATLLIACAVTIPVYLSGEEAEHTVEAFASASHHELEEHEEHAELSLWIMMVSGISALLTLVAYRYANHLVSKARLATAILGALGFVTLIPLANHGGKIMHEELRDNATKDLNASPTPSEPTSDLDND
jgi:Ca2+/Na+ antiporter